MQYEKTEMLEHIIKQYSEKDKISLLIRHADRDAIPENELGNEILLNGTGKKRALKFGEELSKLTINRIFSSPIPRCVQTAEYIARGYGKTIEIIKAKELGDPGLHISDDKLAGEFFRTNGPEILYNNFIQNREIPSFTNREELKIKMTDFLTKKTKENGLTLFITHDILIALYLFSINGKIYSKNNWVKYLDGIILRNGRYEE